MAVSILLLHRIAIFFGCPIKYKPLILCAVMAFLVNFATLNISPFLTPMHYALILIFVLTASLGVTFYNARLLKKENLTASANIRGEPDAAGTDETDAVQAAADDSADEVDAAQATADESVDETDAAQASADESASEADAAQATADESADEADVAQVTADESADEADVAQATADESADEVDVAQATADETADEEDAAEATANESASEADATEATADESAGEVDVAQATADESADETGAAQETANETSDEADAAEATVDESADETDAAQETADETSDEADAAEATVDESADETDAAQETADETSDEADVAEATVDESADETDAAQETADESADEEDSDLEPAVLPSEEERQRAKEELRELTEAVGRLHSMDDYLDYADRETKAHRPRRAVFAYKKALGIYWNDDYAPFIAINLSNTYKEMGDYEAASDTYEAALTLPATQKSSAMQQEFHRSIDYLRTIQHILASHGIANMPLAQIPPEVSAEIESAVQEA